ncbi:MAG TPA: DinB family protein [Longimicrobiales bacterium]|nr:DinB family protein [Longimicrobiales bacterium]
MISDEPTVQVADPFLRGLIEQLDAIVLDARDIMDGLTAEQANWQPDGQRWSIGQCLDHVARTVRLYPEAIERMIGDARRRAVSEKPFREGWVSRWTISAMEPPPKLRIRTMRVVEPAERLDAGAVTVEFEAALRRLRELIVAADGVSLRHARMRSPFARVLKFTLGQTFAINLAHARRHLWQARQVCQHANFPA